MAVKLETVVNLAILATCAGMAVTMARMQPQVTVQRNMRPEAYHKGDRLGKIDGLQLDGVDRTLIVGIRSDCPYCEASMPFYRRLINECGGSIGTRVQIVVATSDDLSTSERLLSSNHIAVTKVLPLIKSSADFRILSTPTLILTDPSRTINDVWVGRLGKDGEARVISEVCS